MLKRFDGNEFNGNRCNRRPNRCGTRTAGGDGPTGPLLKSTSAAHRTSLQGRTDPVCREDGTNPPDSPPPPFWISAFIFPSTSERAPRNEDPRTAVVVYRSHGLGFRLLRRSKATIEVNCPSEKTAYRNSRAVLAARRLVSNDPATCRVYRSDDVRRRTAPKNARRTKRPSGLPNFVGNPSFPKSHSDKNRPAQYFRISNLERRQRVVVSKRHG